MKKVVSEELVHLLDLVDGYLVGGCVRDYILNITPKDWDVVTPLDMDELSRRLSSAGISHFNVGAHFSVTLVTLKSGLKVDVARMRSDIGVPTDRRNQDIEFTGDIRVDLKRRDFTINAIAWKNGEMIYLEHAEEDILNRKLRFVGEPHLRISEDPLRILRAIRFAITKDMVIEQETMNDIIEYRNTIKSLSQERITCELDRMLAHNPAKTIEFLLETGILEIILPDVYNLKEVIQDNSFHKGRTILDHTLDVLKVLCHNGDLVTIYAALLHDIGKPATKTTVNGVDHFYGHEAVGAEMAWNIARGLKLSKQISSDIEKLVRWHCSRFNNIKIRKFTNLEKGFGNDLELFSKLTRVMEADCKNEEDIKNCKVFSSSVITYINNKENVFSLKDINIKGSDPIFKKYAGVEIGKMLKRIFELVSSGALNNVHSDIVAFLKGKEWDI